MGIARSKKSVLARLYKRGGRNKKNAGSSVTYHSQQSRSIDTKPPPLATSVHGDRYDKP